MERGTRLWNRKRGSMPVEIPLATENLLENTGGGRSTPISVSRGGSLQPSIYADARYIDDVLAF